VLPKPFAQLKSSSCDVDRKMLTESIALDELDSTANEPNDVAEHLLQ
jgi:hypothetical protein